MPALTRMPGKPTLPLLNPRAPNVVDEQAIRRGLNLNKARAAPSGAAGCYTVARVCPHPAERPRKPWRSRTVRPRATATPPRRRRGTCPKQPVAFAAARCDLLFRGCHARDRSRSHKPGGTHIHHRPKRPAAPSGTKRHNNPDQICFEFFVSPVGITLQMSRAPKRVMARMVRRVGSI